MRGAEYDVFLSYCHLDAAIVERIAEQLRRDGLRPFLDKADLTAGGHWQRELADGLARAKSCAVFVGAHPISRWQSEELELALVEANRRSGFRVFPVLLPGAGDPFDERQLPSFLSPRTWVDLRGGVRSRAAQQRLLNAIMGLAQGSRAPTETVGDLEPYRGLDTFEEEHAQLFFGREREIQRLLEALKTSSLLCVVGPSGCGKSSLVRAGLVPRLRDGALSHVEACEVRLVRPGAHPLQALATQLAPLGAASSMQATLAALATDRRTLHLAVSLALGADSPDSRVLIVVDQLEEVFTLCDDEAERIAFFDNLLYAAFARGGQTLVVLTMRVDFYARCASYPELKERTAQSLALVGPMNDDELRQAIEAPAHLAKRSLEPGLVETILADVGPDPGALPLLEHALLELWRACRGPQLTLDGYHDAGRVEGALAKRAESVFESFTPGQQQIARRTLLRLTQPGEGTEDTRRRTTRGELAPAETDESFDIVLDRLVGARLLTTGRDDDGQEVVDVSHEALIRGWPRLRTWIEADRAGLVTHRRLTDAAREWQALNREPGALSRGARLATAREWAAEHPDDLSRLERDFLAASEAAARAERDASARRTRNLRLLAGGLAALSVVVGALAVWSLGQSAVADRQRSIAERQRGEARRQAGQATSLALTTASAAQLRAGRPRIGLMLAYEGYRMSPRAEARRSVMDALDDVRRSGPGAIIGGLGATIEEVAFSPKGHVLAAVTNDDSIRLLDPRTRKPLGAPLKGHTEAIAGIAFSPDGRTLASASDDDTICLWDVATRRLTARLQFPRAERAFLGPTDSGVASVAFSPDGRTLASGGKDDLVRLWSVRTHRQLGAPLKEDFDVDSVAFSPDRTTLATVAFDHITLWNLRTRRARARLTGHESFVTSIAFSPDGRTLASGSDDNTVRLWDADTGKQRGEPMTGHTDAVLGVAYSPDGRTLASVGQDAKIRLWSVDTHEPVGTRLSGRDNYFLTSVAFSPDGRTLASGTWDDSVWLWRLRGSGAVAARLAGDGAAVRRIAFSPDRSTVAALDDDGRLRLWDEDRLAPLGRPLAGNSSSIVDFAFSADGRKLVSIDDDATARVWKVPSGALERTLPGPDDSYGTSRVLLSRDGHTVVVASDTDGVTGFDLRGRKTGYGEQREFDATTDGEDTVAISPDGRILASADGSADVQLSAVESGKPIDDLDNEGFVSALAFSPAGRMLAVGRKNGTVVLLDPGSGDQIGAEMSGHRLAVTTVAFSPDGRTLASAAGDGSVLLWDVPSGKQLGTVYSGRTGAVKDVAFSADGRTIAWTAGRTVQLRTDVVWATSADLRRTVCDSAGNALNDSSWRNFAPGIPYRDSCGRR